MAIKTIAFSLLFSLLASFTNKLPATKPAPTSISGENIEHENHKHSLAADLAKMNDLFLNLYEVIEKNPTKPSFPLFKKAMLGYYNLLAQGKLEKKDILTIIDFTLPSNKKRLWIIDFVKKKVLVNDFVAHGRATGNIKAENFSNLVNSHMSSLGFYVTGKTYYGKHGLSLRLNGMEAKFNDNAFSRAIVVHGADYVSQEFIDTYGRLGRSYGCPAVSNGISKTVINTIKEKSCLFIYADALDYDVQSALLNTDPVLDYLSGQNFALLP